MDKIATYCGKPIEQMTREELIDALNFLASQLTAEREEHAHQLDVLTGRVAQQSAQAEARPIDCNCASWFLDGTHHAECCHSIGKTKSP